MAHRGHELRGFDRQAGVSAGRCLCFREHIEPNLSEQSACKAKNPAAASGPARPRVPRFYRTRLLPITISTVTRFNSLRTSIPRLEVLGTRGGVACRPVWAPTRSAHRRQAALRLETAAPTARRG